MAVKKLVLKKLRLDERVVDPETGKPSLSFQRWVNDNSAAVEKFASDLIDVLVDQGIIQDAADAAAALVALTNSYAESLTPPSAILNAAVSTADTTKGKITIADHKRVYTNGTTVTVTGGTIDLLNLNTAYYVYYNDPARAGGAVTYAVTTSEYEASQVGNRHCVGSATTPATSSDPPLVGVPSRPPGIPYKLYGYESDV